MEDRWKVAGILLMFLFLVAGYTVYSLPSSVYSPEKNSLTEAGVIQLYLEPPGIAAKIYVNAKPVDVAIDLSNVKSISSTPAGDASEEELVWKGVYSKRSITYYRGNAYDEINYRGDLKRFTNPLNVRIVRQSGQITALVANAGDYIIKNILIGYKSKTSSESVPAPFYTGFIDMVEPGKTVTIPLGSVMQYADTNKFREGLKNTGLSEYAMNRLSGDYNWLFSRTDQSYVNYVLPREILDSELPLKTSTPLKINRVVIVAFSPAVGSG